MTKFELPEKPKKTNTSEDFNNLRKAVDELDKFDYTWKTYANKADRRINAANKYIEELERENQRLITENLGVKTLVDKAKPQQALPVVPECVAEWIEDLKNKGYGPLKNPGTYGEAISDLSDESLEKILTWISQHQEEFMRAWLDGYTVEKPQLFYLKHIDMSKQSRYCDCYLVKEDDGTLWHDDTINKNEKPGGGYKNSCYKFTQQEIDSMQTGSYEQIEVEE